MSFRCDPTEVCDYDETDRARCFPASEQACVPGSSFCGDGAEAWVCSDDGTWSVGVCDHACRDTALGAACVPSFATATFTGAMFYEARKPDSQYRAWGELIEVPAQGLLAVTYRDGQILDATVLDESGVFELQVPSRIRAGDFIRFFAIGVGKGNELAYMVAYPGPGTGVRSPWSINPAETSAWYWDLDLVDAPDGSGWTLNESGSAPMRLFDWLRYTWAAQESSHGREGKSLVVWHGPETNWDCGACFMDWPFAGYDSHIFIPGSRDDASYWSDPVTVHELGHWSMASFSTATQEGNRHCIGVPALPGLAWSEGWATYLSSELRSSPVYYDVQDGTFFWFDLAQGYPWGPIARPTADGELFQLVDENWVAASLWKMARSGNTTRTRLQQAFSSRRMTQAPFARGYTARQFSVNERCEPINVQSTDLSVPMFADYLDALRCLDVSASVIDGAVAPYPYPADAPLCR